MALSKSTESVTAANVGHQLKKILDIQLCQQVTHAQNTLKKSYYFYVEILFSLIKPYYKARHISDTYASCLLQSADTSGLPELVGKYNTD